MPWTKIDDQFYDHPKVVAAGPLGIALFVCGLSYCSRHLTDGFISTIQVRRLIDIDDPRVIAEKLIAVGLWERRDGGYQVHDYLDYNPSRARIEATRRARAEAGREGGLRSGEARRKQTEGEAKTGAKQASSKEEANVKQNAKQKRTPSPSPSPDPIPESPAPEDLPPTAGADAPPPPSEPKAKPKKRKRKDPSPKQQAARDMFEALAQACQINLTTLTDTQRKQLNQSEKILRADDAIPADMEPFSTWWYANDWRGKKGDAPRPAQVRETWGQFKAWREGGQRGAKGEPAGFEGIREWGRQHGVTAEGP